MPRTRIDSSQLSKDTGILFWERDLLLASGDFSAGRYNAMTVGWGAFGVMWGKNYAQVVVRPTRYTYEFMNEFETFTLCAFSERYSSALGLLGSKSGRDGDKIAESGLSAEPSVAIAAPSFAEADLAIECKKIYWDDLDPSRFLDAGIATQYPKRDYHRVFYGEIVAAFRS